jgi:hypothetical protein
MTTREQLAQVLHPDLLDRLDAYIDERVTSAVNALRTTKGGGRWVTLEDGADLAGCSPDALRMRIKRRPSLYHVRHEGSRIYVLRADVDPEPDERPARPPTHH